MDAWGTLPEHDISQVLERSLTHIGAYVDRRLVGFVNIAWDGGIHAFLLDVSVLPSFRRKGIATNLVRQAIASAKARGAKWLHVDFEPHLEVFYSACGFRDTRAGLIDLKQ